jgi:hypothetical protein
MKTLKLFNAVTRKNNGEIFVSEDGYVIDGGAVWAKNQIVEFYRQEKLSGNDLNKTFHKSWQKIINSYRLELLMEQIQHYLSTYGSNFQDEVYIPCEVLKVPKTKLTFKVIRSFSIEEMTEKCLNMLRSGIALTEETVDDLLCILTDELKYSFTGKEGIRNKEAIIKIADMYNIYPDNPVEFLRYVVYKATGETLLIKNHYLINKIKESTYNPSSQLRGFGVNRLGEIFNRFKPIFLAFKKQCPKTINEISKASKVYHKPLIENPLNLVTHRLLDSSKLHWLDNATPFALFKTLTACNSRMCGQSSFLYRIRNGKSWSPLDYTSTNTHVCKLNYNFILEYLKQRYRFSGKKFYFPENVSYSLPTSEKMFVGNIPTGSKFYGKRLAAGIYWENSWGARDIDLSGLLSNGDKIGWDSHYSSNTGELAYSGDMTDATNGAVEYLYSGKNFNDICLVYVNIFNGAENSKYKIVVGEGDNMSREYMMNPNKVLLEVASESIQQSMILGLISNEKDSNSNCFTLLNCGSGSKRVSVYGNLSQQLLQSLYEQSKFSYNFEELIGQLGGVLVDDKDEADYNYEVNALTKDSFTKLFEVQYER